MTTSTDHYKNPTSRSFMFEVPRAPTSKITLFLHVTPYSLVATLQLFFLMCCARFTRLPWSTTKYVPPTSGKFSSSNTQIQIILSTLTSLPWNVLYKWPYVWEQIIFCLLKNVVLDTFVTSHVLTQTGTASGRAGRLVQLFNTENTAAR